MRKTLGQLDSCVFCLGDAPEAEQPGFEDAGWDRVRIPHDWSFAAGPSARGDQGPEGGYYPGGIGWYRHRFEAPELRPDQQLFVRFDGLYMNSDVWLNGQHLGRLAYGYRSVEYDLTPALRPGENLLAVRCDNTLEPSARWYHPCGIYAPATFEVRPRQRIGEVFAFTVEASARRAVVRVQLTPQDPPPEFKYRHHLIAPDGRVAARVILADAVATLVVDEPSLWSPESPMLYTLRTELVSDGKVRDEVETKLGLRTVRWCQESGFWLNDQNLKLRGVCEHWEGGPVGGAWSPSLLRWKLQTLMAMGCNSIRTAHHPFPPFFYDLCDELGILVLSEFFDGWKRKAKHDYGAQAFDRDWEKDLRDTLRRDRNHPCIILWSVGNETEGPIARDLVRVCHEEDPTRRVTSGNAEPEMMDVVGLNGPSERRDFLEAERQFADQPMVATEAPHTWQVRGYYRTKSWFRDGFPNERQSPFPLPDLTEHEVFTYDWINPRKKADPVKQVFNSSYDNAMVRITARQNWAFARDLPWHAGHFRWTGFDYPGEAGYVHGGWPFRAFMGGTHDLAGFPKDLAYFYRSQWTAEPMVHLLPHWTHPRTLPGTAIPVWAYTNADEVELWLNGRSLGVRSPSRDALRMQCEWMAPWEPGELLAVARVGGVEVARTTQATAGPASKLRGEVETLDDGWRILTTALVDAQDRLEPYADHRVFFYLPSPARRVVHENGNPVDTDKGVDTLSRRAFMGLLRSFVQRADPDLAAWIGVGAILGSRNGATPSADDSAIVTFAVTQQPLDHKATPATPPANLTITFTTDGTDPTPQSPRYDQPFVVKFPATVRALVTVEGEAWFEMHEDFGPDQALYWPDTDADADVHLDDRVEVFPGQDMEHMDRRGQARSARQHAGFHGHGYVELAQPGDGVSWYQENDGAEGDATLRLRFAMPAAKHHTASLKIAINQDDPQTLELDRTLSDAEANGWHILTAVIRLKQGGNEITLTSVSQDTIALDRVALM